MLVYSKIGMIKETKEDDRWRLIGEKFSDCVDWLFFTGASISLVMPFIPVYVEQLGTPKDQIELFSD